MLVEDKLRELVADNMVGDSPIAVALLGIADAMGEQRRGTDALTERVERVEEEVLASSPDPRTTA